MMGNPEFLRHCVTHLLRNTDQGFLGTWCRRGGWEELAFFCASRRGALLYMSHVRLCLRRSWQCRCRAAAKEYTFSCILSFLRNYKNTFADTWWKPVWWRNFIASLCVRTVTEAEILRHMVQQLTVKGVQVRACSGLARSWSIHIASVMNPLGQTGLISW